MQKFAASPIVLAFALLTAAPAFAQDQVAPEAAKSADDAGAPDTGAEIIVTAKATRAATALSQVELQKILPGISPLKAIQTLP
ncbi:hypothetical protein ABTL20_21590, partial [Acinetobacter baumannii]